MDYRIIEREAFRVIGKVFKVSCKDGDHNNKIAQIWEESSTDGTSEKFRAIDSTQNMLGVCMDFDEEKEELSYMIAIEDVNLTNSTDFESREISAATWAVFTSVGPLPQSIISVWANIFQAWFPTSGYRHDNVPDLEVYLPGDPSAQDYKCEIRIPIIKN